MRTLVGKVISNKMDKTISVLVERLWEHPVYKKRIRRSRKYLVHTDKKIAEGKFVKIGEVKPISKNKNWKVIEIVKK
jgi:small subunit ribosomal protein S17